ncbi:unnamed protein product [Diatraea saccharalis]|uniref:Uncharacterized protein n=1 Tax=Diatraea saccharalis TaxID=40085 RepID=A0A9N9RI41_9NEOP|nr:unnamed protein product [Diatraea saccharalis]
MVSAVVFCIAVLAILDSGQCVSSKIDFEEEETSIVANATKVEDEDLEVKHTIVVSTKLRNNNRRGLHNRGDGEGGTLTYRVGNRNGDDSSEVPIVKGYKALDTTEIRTPDSRHKAQIYPESVLVSRNIRDEYDYYPNVALNPTQWKPSNFYNNINWWQQDNRETFERRNFRPNNQGKLNRKITDDAIKDFYCKKCRELIIGQRGKGCIQERSNPWVHESTTAKIKLDGKLAKLN